MTRFAATTLDLSSLPPPEVVKDLSYDAILAARIKSLKLRLEEAGVDWDVGDLLTDPLAMAEREDAFRELLSLAQINDAAEGVMLAFATGGTLDQLAAFYGVRRRVVRAATDDAPAALEGDKELRRRAQVAPEALTTAGSAGSYVHHALEASAEVVDVAVVIPSLGRVDVILLARDADAGPSAEARLAVRERLLSPEIRPLTAEINVRGATAVPFAIDATMFVRIGPDPSIVRSESQKAVRRLLAERRAIGAAIPRSAIIAAAHVAGVERVELSEPVMDVRPGPDQVASCADLVIRWELADG